MDTTPGLILGTVGYLSPEQVRGQTVDHRSDIFTHDALAWALAAAGKTEAAQSHLERALAEGTEDARLFFHAAVIAAKSGREADARRCLLRPGRIQRL